MDGKNILKVIIADDERMVCVVIEKCIHWEELGMELVGIAYDGNDLFEQIQQKRPDIVITDISMPERNGLDLIELVRKENIKCRIVIISGYRQFEYAHKALKNNVDDYLLKPIDEQELNESLTRLRESILEEHMTGKEKVKSLIMNNEKDKEKIREMFLTRLMEKGEECCMEPEVIEKEYGIRFGEGIYQAVSVRLDFLESGETMDDMLSILKKLELILKKIFIDVCKEFLVVFEKNYIIAALYYDGNYGKEMKERYKEAYERGRNIVELFQGYALTLGISGEYRKLKKLPDALKEAMAAVCYRLLKGTDRIIYYEELFIPEKKWNQDKWKEMEGELKRDFEILDMTDFRQHMNKIFFVEQETCNVLEMIDISRKILRLFFSETEKMEPENEELKEQEKEVLSKVEYAVSLYRLKKIVLDVIMGQMEQLEEKRRNQKKRPVREAQKYISKYYMKSLTLEMVAQEVKLNPVYFSNMFKKETGENFLDYLHKYRVEASKEILRNETCSIVEVAIRVGYSDAKYFSKIFKKHVGIKPSDYRNIYG